LTNSRKRVLRSHQHETLRAFLDKGVRDGVIQRQIDKWLKAGVMEEGQLRKTDKGMPQGGNISPLLSNIYLHEVLDEWYVSIKSEFIGESYLVRYADDSVPRTQTAAILFSGATHKMRDGPSEPVYRHRLQTTLCCIN